MNEFMMTNTLMLYVFFVFFFLGMGSVLSYYKNTEPIYIIIIIICSIMMSLSLNEYIEGTLKWVWNTSNE